MNAGRRGGNGRVVTDQVISSRCCPEIQGQAGFFMYSILLAGLGLIKQLIGGVEEGTFWGQLDLSTR